MQILQEKNPTGTEMVVGLSPFGHKAFGSEAKDPFVRLKFSGMFWTRQENGCPVSSRSCATIQEEWPVWINYRRKDFDLQGTQQKLRSDCNGHFLCSWCHENWTKRESAEAKIADSQGIETCSDVIMEPRNDPLKAQRTQSDKVTQI